jgi:F-type H+-transporting ATPase subunit b
MSVMLAGSLPFFERAETWVGVAFFIFVGIVVYLGVPRLICKTLDDRADAIRKELDEARKLREEAENLLADYQKRAREAEEEAQGIIEQAKREAEALASETRAALQDSVARRARQAEEKIARAESQAVSDVRAAAVDAAISTAETILKTKAAGDTGNRLLSESIEALRGKLN